MIISGQSVRTPLGMTGTAIEEFGDTDPFWKVVLPDGTCEGWHESELFPVSMWVAVALARGNLC